MFKSFFNFLRTHRAFLAQLILVLVFIGALVWGVSISTSQMQPLPPPLQANNNPVSSPNSGLTSQTPADFTPNQYETEGIIFAGVLLVLIIVVGTLGVINQRG